jgi:stringent starvation protein B
MASTTRLPPKKDVALALLEQSSVYVHLDPRGETVRVPPWFKKQPQLVLQVGLNMPVPIPDLHLDDDGLSCTLSFNRSPHLCKVPWAAVYALIGESGRGMVWPDDVPAEVAAQVQNQKPQPKPRGHLRAVEPTAEEAAPPPPVDIEAAKATDEAKKKKRAKRAKRAKDAKRTLDAVPERKPQPAQPRPAPVAVEEPAPVESKSDDAAADSSPPSKRKRELPPYLRIVK